MTYMRFVWDDPDDPKGNVRHIDEHGLDVEDVEEILRHPTSEGWSASSGLPVVWGYTLENVHIIVIYEEIDDVTIRVVTTYDVPEP